MLRLENVDVFHGDAQAIDGVSLEVEQGAIVAIIGANGAGKTSLIRTIAGIHKPARGRIVFHNEDIAGWPSHRVCDLGIGQVAEGRQIFPSLSVAENLAMGAMIPRARASRAQNLERVYELFPRLTERRTPGRRDAVRRRAANAGDRPLPDGRAGAGHVRRAFARPRADHRPKHAQDHSRP